MKFGGQTIDQLLSAAALDHTAVAQRFRAASAADWTSWKRLKSANTHSTVLPAAHIHAVKGAEFDAVLLDIEDQPNGTRPHILQLWNPKRPAKPVVCCMSAPAEPAGCSF